MNEAAQELEAGTTGPHVYQAICTVQAELAKTGIAKTRENTQQKYKFRGIDEVYSALSPLLAQHKLVVVPRITERVCVERVSQTGNPLFNVTVHAEFDFVSALDGTTHTAMTYGEAMDSADKATNKAMSAAYKYAAFMTFAIPTEGDNDADADTHHVSREKIPGVTKIKERLRRLKTLGDESQSLDAFNGFVSTYKDDLTAIKEANHEWWTGDDADEEGFKAWILRRRSELAITDEQPSDTGFAMCMETLEACTSLQELAAWYKLNGKYVEQLDQESFAKVNARYDELRAGFEQVDTMTVGG